MGTTNNCFHFLVQIEARLRFHSLLLRTVAASVTPLTVSAIGIDFCSVPTVVKQFGSPWGCHYCTHSELTELVASTKKSDRRCYFSVAMETSSDSHTS